MTKITQTWTPLPALLDDFAGEAFADFHARLNEEGHPSIRAGHGCVFRFIHEGGSRLTDLACSSGLSKQAVGEVVDDLESLGYVERDADPQDRRAKVIRLTKKGAAAQRAAIGIFSDMERNWAERYGAERVEAMRSLLEEIARERVERRALD
ncbi:MAG TPA: MarR family transcriptional regulator [Thermoleophilaceae bacterium]